MSNHQNEHYCEVMKESTEESNINIALFENEIHDLIDECLEMARILNHIEASRVDFIGEAPGYLSHEIAGIKCSFFKMESKLKRDGLIT